ncbi:MAG: methyltransferase domain-containing protein, partial [Bdellovibrionales bacterium]|nr:methyltransferase domain-containing protein [Bdellovibrionales bacterium]
GRGVDLPIALWLLGAAKIYTIDLNSYLKAELIKESLDFIKNYPDEIKSILSNSISKERLEKLLLLDLEGDVISRLFELCNITYLAPADASKIELPANSIDLHLSYTVFEHIPQIDLIEILIEGNRLLRSDGLHIHLIDYSDHFSHSDDNISPINFLQYDEESWNSLAGNKYMYCNRLREDDVMSVFDKASIDLIQIESCKKEELRSLLSSNEFFLDEKFSTKSEDCLITTSTWLVGKPRH